VPGDVCRDARVFFEQDLTSRSLRDSSSRVNAGTSKLWVRVRNTLRANSPTRHTRLALLHVAPAHSSVTQHFRMSLRMKGTVSPNESPLTAENALERLDAHADGLDRDVQAVSAQFHVAVPDFDLASPCARLHLFTTKTVVRVDEHTGTGDRMLELGLVFGEEMAKHMIGWFEAMSWRVYRTKPERETEELLAVVETSLAACWFGRATAQLLELQLLRHEQLKTHPQGVAAIQRGSIERHDGGGGVAMMKMLDHDDAAEEEMEDTEAEIPFELPYRTLSAATAAAGGDQRVSTTSAADTPSIRAAGTNATAGVCRYSAVRPRMASASKGRNASLVTESECSDNGYYGEQAVLPNNEDGTFDPFIVPNGAPSTRLRHSLKRPALHTR
jgi:hypothetical protein